MNAINEYSSSFFVQHASWDLQEHAHMGLTASMPQWDLQRMPQPDLQQQASIGLTATCPHGTCKNMPTWDLQKACHVGQTLDWNAEKPENDQKSPRVLPFQTLKQATEVVLQRACHQRVDLQLEHAIMGLTASMPSWDLQRMPQPDLHQHARKGLTESMPQPDLQQENAIMGLTASMPAWDLQRMPQPGSHQCALEGLTESMPPSDLQQHATVGQEKADEENIISQGLLDCQWQ